MNGAHEVHFYDASVTGWPKDQFLGLTDKIAQHVSERAASGHAVVKKFYIGVASGADMKAALNSRYDTVKADFGISHMYGIYHSSSEAHSRAVEKQLCTYFEDHKLLLNERDGGGGRKGAGPNFYVYLALCKWGKSSDDVEILQHASQLANASRDAAQAAAAQGQAAAAAGASQG